MNIHNLASEESGWKLYDSSHAKWQMLCKDNDCVLLFCLSNHSIIIRVWGYMQITLNTPRNFEPSVVCVISVTLRHLYIKYYIVFRIILNSYLHNVRMKGNKIFSIEFPVENHSDIWEFNLTSVAWFCVS